MHFYFYKEVTDLPVRSCWVERCLCGLTRTATYLNVVHPPVPHLSGMSCSILKMMLPLASLSVGAADASVDGTRI
eukprot:SAG31_NODE_2874_length_4971_cov_9.677750_9_plen_74_part_01